MMKYDLHLHSTSSDGEFASSEVVKMAKERGLDVISITDHDTIDGVLQAQACGDTLGIKVLAGVEISSLQGKEVHVLGYNFDATDEKFLDILKKVQNLRDKRNCSIVNKLRFFNLDISLEEIESKCRGVVGRLHIAKELVEKGHVKTVHQAFDEWIGFGQKAFVEDFRLSPNECIKMLKDFGCITVLAHPCSLKMTDDELDCFLTKLVENGLDGIEGNYFAHTQAEKERFASFAQKFQLINTGGSDFHTFERETTFGQFCMLSEKDAEVLKCCKKGPKTK